MQRPIPDHYIKARYKAALKPIIPDRTAGKPLLELCTNIAAKKEEEVRMYLTSLFLAQKVLTALDLFVSLQEYKYERLLANEFYAQLSSAKLIAVFQV